MGHYFGIYHWQRRFRRLLAGVVGVLGGLLFWRHTRNRLIRLLALAVVLASINRASGPFRSMLDPPPWDLRTTKYARLAASLHVPADGLVLDLGCGTGRSLVGLADGLPAGIEMIGLDVFDDRVILGNGPQLATRNARLAGLDPNVVAGDAARLPFTDDSVDALTACRLLHDLPQADAEAALVECRRVLKPDGHLGVLELPLPHEADAEPDDYWHRQLSTAGFTVESAGTAGLDDRYLQYMATPNRED